jgi:hypothetical protein
MAGPVWNVVQGQWVGSPKWLTFPQTLFARSPHDPNQLCELRVSRGDLFKGAVGRRRQPAYQLWSVLLGKAPPVPHGVEDAEDGLSTLLDAHACFRGIRRPAAEDDDGSQFVAYALKPTAFFSYEFLAPLVFSSKHPVPPDLVFLAFARLDEPSDGATIKGVLTHWDFVDADERDPMMPADYDSRFHELLWRR